MINLLLVLLAYLIGSASFGRIVAAIKRDDLVSRDVPGGSGIFRQYGPAWGVAVAILDLLKGVLVAYLTRYTSADWAFIAMGFALVSGHNWPIYFGFRGGGGIAPTIGFFGMLFPQLMLMGVGLGLLVAALYWQLYWKKSRSNWYPVPMGALIAYAYILFSLWPNKLGFWAFLAVSVAVAIRGIRITQNKW